jgi:hypothetical protein
MSCHSTAQAISAAQMMPTGGCTSQSANWFRNLPGTQAFGRFTPQGSTCVTDMTGLTLTAADYSLQLASTVTRAVSTTSTFNPCTWDDDAPPSATPSAPAGAGASRGAPPSVPSFEVTRDPKPPQ